MTKLAITVKLLRTAKTEVKQAKISTHMVLSRAMTTAWAKSSSVAEFEKSRVLEFRRHTHTGGRKEL